MKTFVIACIVLAVILVGITVNAIFIRRTTDHIIDDASRMPEQIDQSEVFKACLSTVDGIDKTLEKHRFALSLAISHGDLETLESLILRLRAACREENGNAYAAARELLIAKINNIKTSEGLSLDGII